MSASQHVVSPPDKLTLRVLEERLLLLPVVALELRSIVLRSRRRGCCQLFAFGPEAHEAELPGEAGSAAGAGRPGVGSPRRWAGSSGEGERRWAAGSAGRTAAGGAAGTRPAGSLPAGSHPAGIRPAGGTLRSCGCQLHRKLADVTTLRRRRPEACTADAKPRANHRLLTHAAGRRTAGAGAGRCSPTGGEGGCSGTGCRPFCLWCYKKRMASMRKQDDNSQPGHAPASIAGRWM